MTTVKPEDLGAAIDGAHLASAMPYIQSEFSKLENALISKVLQQVSAQDLSPEKAQQAWFELAAYRRVIKRLTTAVNVGTSIGEKISGELAHT